MRNKTNKCICVLGTECYSGNVMYFEVQSASLRGGHKLILADHENITLGVHFLQDVEMIGL
jgi:hypothetical protein